MAKEIIRNAGKKAAVPPSTVSSLEALTAPEGRSMDRLEAIENNEAYIGLPPEPGHRPKARVHYENLEAAAPGVRDSRFKSLRGEERIAEAVTIADLGAVGADLGMPEGTTLGTVHERLQTGADGVTGMEENPQLKAYAAAADIEDEAQPSQYGKAEGSYEYYDGHRFHVIRNIGVHTSRMGAKTITADFSVLGDNDEEYNTMFSGAIDDLINDFQHAQSTKQHSGLAAETLFRHWRTLGGSFDLEQVGQITQIKARPGANLLGTLVISALGGLGALCFLIAALYIFGPYLPPLTN